MILCLCCNYYVGSKSSSMQTPIYITAVRTSDLGGLTSCVTFDRVVANSGGLSAGPFTVPIAGVYYLSFTATGTGKSRVYLKINNDVNNAIAHAWTDSRGALVVQSIFHLNVGDKVCVHLQDGVITGMGAAQATTFSAFLLYAD